MKNNKGYLIMSIDSFKLSYSDDSGSHNLYLQKDESAKAEECVTIANTSYSVRSSLKDIPSAKQILALLQHHGPFVSIDNVKQNLNQRGISSISTSDQIDTPTVRKIVSVLSERFEKRYISSSLGQRCKEKLQENLHKGLYDSIRDPLVLTQALTADLRQVTNDKHAKVLIWEHKELHVVSKAALPKIETPQLSDNPHRNYLNDLRARQAMWKAENYGIHEVRMLEGGSIGLVDIHDFPGIDPVPEDVLDGKTGMPVASSDLKKEIRDQEVLFQKERREAFGKAMDTLNGSESIIIDLRKNNGGAPRTIEYLLSFLLPPGVRINTIEYREKPTEIYTSLSAQEVPMQRRVLDTPIYVLTSEHTFSGGEELAYDLKVLGRAKIIGTITGGGANPCDLDNLSDEEEMYAVIPIGQAKNPHTQTNWEGIGVTPDIVTDPASALDVALSMIHLNHAR